MSALQRLLIGVDLTKRVLVDIGFVKGTGRYWLSKRVLIDDGLASVSEVFIGR